MSITDAQISGLQENIGTYIDSRIGNFLGVQPPEYNKTIPGQCTERSIRGTYPTVSGIETGQHFLNLVAERHCSSGFEWFKSCGPGLSGYEPSITTPFELTGYPTNDKGFWERYKANIGELGQAIARNFTYSPWKNHGSAVGWSGTSYSPEYNYPVSGRHPIPSGMFDYGKMFSNDFHAFVPDGLEKYPSFYNLFDYRKHFDIRLYSDLSDSLSDRKVIKLGYTGAEEIPLSIRPYISGYIFEDGQWVPAEDMGASRTISLTDANAIVVGGSAIPPLYNIMDGPIKFVSSGECFQILGSGTRIDSQPATYPQGLFYDGGDGRPGGGSQSYLGDYDGLPFPIDEVEADHDDHSAIIWMGNHYITYEAEFYRSSGSLNLWPVYQYIYGLGGDFASFSGDYSLATETISEGIGVYTPFTPGAGNNITISDPVGQGSIGILNSGDLFSRNYNCYGYNPPPVFGSVAKVKRNALLTTIEGGDIKRCIFFPLEGEDGLRSSFKGITGIITSGVNHIKLEDSMPYLGHYFSDRGLKQYSETWLEDRNLIISDYISNNILDFHGKKFFTASGAVEYCQDGYNNSGKSIGGDLLATYDLGNLIFTSGKQWGDIISKIRDDWFFIPSGFFPKTVDGPHSLDVSLFGCENSGEQFIGLFFDYDMTAKSGELYELSKDIPISTTSYLRTRKKWSGVRVDPTYTKGGTFAGLTTKYAKFSTPYAYQSPWSDWMYETILPTASGSDFGDQDFTWFMNGMGEQTRAIPPEIARTQVTVTFPSSALPHTHMNIGGSLLELEPPLRMYSGEDSAFYYSF